MEHFWQSASEETDKWLLNVVYRQGRFFGPGCSDVQLAKSRALCFSKNATAMDTAVHPEVYITTIVDIDNVRTFLLC